MEVIVFKDSKQLKTDYGFLSENLISSIIESNKLRKSYIAKIIDLNPKSIGIYRLSMKKNSDNFRQSAIVDIIKILQMKINTNIKIYEPNIKEEKFQDICIEKNLNIFKKDSELIIANRLSEDLEDVKDKVFSRDIFEKINYLKIN